MAEQQQHPRGAIVLLHLLDPRRLLLQTLLIAGHQRLCFSRFAEQLSEFGQVVLQRGDVGLGREQLNAHAGGLELRQNRRRPHFGAAHQDVRLQRQNAFGRQRPLVTDARQAVQGARVLAGAVDTHQLALATQGDHPFAERATGADPALGQGVGHGHLAHEHAGAGQQ
ncbi:hypothetical protein D3C76_931050 [compost metagenome]